MYRKKDDELKPRNGHTLEVVIVARISGSGSQSEMSIDDQIDHAKNHLRERYDGRVNYRELGTTGKGERLDRPELDRLRQWLKSNEIDVLIAEDLGRICRGLEAAQLCGVAKDHGTRFFFLNDNIDSNDSDWEEDAIDATGKHLSYNTATSLRLKQKLLNRFEKFGGAMARPIMGYSLPAGAKTYKDWQKVEAMTPIYQEWFHRLETVPNCQALADWLNDTKVPVGPYSRKRHWTARQVMRYTRNSLLMGRPGRGFRHTIKRHSDGRRVSVPNPQGRHTLSVHTWCTSTRSNGTAPTP